MTAVTVIKTLTRAQWIDRQNRFTEEVRGVVVGDMEPPVRWVLCYEERPQRDGFVETSGEAVPAGMAALEAIKQELGDTYLLIYPSKDRWTVRVYDVPYDDEVTP
jgi:hypothetical protein